MATLLTLIIAVFSIVCVMLTHQSIAQPLYEQNEVKVDEVKVDGVNIDGTSIDGTKIDGITIDGVSISEGKISGTAIKENLSLIHI